MSRAPQVPGRGADCGTGRLVQICGVQKSGLGLDHFELDSDVAALEKAFEPAVDSNQPDLRAFAGRGGKLIMYHGWNDHLIAPGNTVDYYNAVLYTMGVTRTNESVRLFMVPGMMHCRGGDGTPDFDMIPELDNWVEQGKAPDRVVASRTNPDRTRPLCPYPLVAVYKGTGSTDAAESFVCGRLR